MRLRNVTLLVSSATLIIATFVLLICTRIPRVHMSSPGIVNFKLIMTVNFISKTHNNSSTRQLGKETRLNCSGWSTISG